MVTIDIAQLTAEANSWREQMRRYRDELTHFKNQLLHVAMRVTRQDQLRDVEHYENQFYIQLINIHDLKQSIKLHDYKTSMARAAQNGKINHTMLAEHEHLHNEYQRLQHRLEDLKGRFKGFVNEFR